MVPGMLEDHAPRGSHRLTRRERDHDLREDGRAGLGVVPVFKTC